VSDVDVHSMEIFDELSEVERIGNRAVRKAQAESRRLGVPNVYSINGVIHYELPSGELTTEDPYRRDRRPTPNK